MYIKCIKYFWLLATGWSPSFEYAPAKSGEYPSDIPQIWKYLKDKSFGPSFSPFDTDGEDEVSEIFIISLLCVWRVR